MGFSVEIDGATGRATLENLLEFANAVREAGGGNPLDALMPSIPTDPQQCLIAKNLNFNCTVDCAGVSMNQYGNIDKWVMWLDDREVRNRIAKKLGLFRVNDHDGDREDVCYGIVLPDPIGAVANDFDHAMNAVKWDEDTTRYRELYPYIEASIREVENQGKFNDKGELIL